MKKLIFLMMVLSCFGVQALAPGIYKVEVVFGSQTFVDLMTVEENLTGTFTVPGNFSVPININIRSGLLDFILRAREGNREINFEFMGNHKRKTLSGDIFDLSTQRVIGQFEGEMLYAY